MKYPVCKLAHILNPGKYCLVSTDKEHVSEVRNLEDKLNEEMLIGADTLDISLSCQMYVAVTDLSGQLRRGVIEKKLDQNLYEVLLIDYGRIVQIRDSNIKVITNKAFVEVEPLSFMVKLYGLIPIMFEYVEGDKKLRTCKNWLPEALAFVQSFCKENQKIVAQGILIRQRTVYGDLFVKPKPDMNFVSLRQLLCKENFCVYSENSFISQEGLSSSNESFELKSKMELVEKWQKDSFEKGQVPSVSFSEASSSTTPFKSDIPIPSLLESKFTWELFQLKDKTTSPGDILTSPDPPFGQPSNLGTGRAKLKLLIAKMKEKSTVSAQQETPLQSDSSGKPGISERPRGGRGKLLKEKWEMMKARSKSTEAPISQIENPDIETDVRCVHSKWFSDPAEGHSSKRHHKTMSRVERSIIKLGEFSEFVGFQQQTEMKLSKDDDFPPLVRATIYEKEESKKYKQTSGTSGQEKPVQAKQEKKRKKSVKSEAHFKSPEAEKSLCVKKTDQVCKRRVPMVNSSSYGAPFVMLGNITVEPVNSFRDLPIQSRIIKNLERGGAFRELGQVQRWAIPAIRKQHSTVVIGSSRTGKTLSYLLPLIDYVQHSSYFEELPEGNGPHVVIVASSTHACESAFYMCHSLLGNFTETQMKNSIAKIVLAHGNGCEKEVWVSLTEGCKMLISTPHCLVRLLETPILTNFERLTCLVLDEIDIISQNPFRKNVRIILEKAKFATRNRSYQKILIGEKWTSSVETLVKTYVDSYALIIGAFSEAVIFRKIKPNIHLVSRSQKKEILVNLIKDGVKKLKTLVVCERGSEATSLSKFLADRGIPTILSHERMPSDKLKDIQATWKISTGTVLIATDGVLSELNIRDVQCLVHFELPLVSKTNFYLRYSTLYRFLEDKEGSSKTRGKKKNLTTKNIILIDDENHRQLPHIVDFVTRLGGKVPEKMFNKCEEIRRMIELDKKNTPICRNLLSFGHCRNFKGCSYRHAFVKALDSPVDLPTNGWVNFVVLKISDASCFHVKLVEHVDSDGTTFKLKDDRSELLDKISEFFKNKNNRRPLGLVEGGVVCAVKSDFGGVEVFYRAKIIEYLKLDKHEKPVEVDVKLLDEGDIWMRKTSELYELPDDLSKHPPTVVDVYLVGVQPKDFDVNWSGISCDFVKKLVTVKLEDTQNWSGKIALALNNTLFLDPIKRKEYLPLLKMEVFDLLLGSELVTKRIAVANSEHLPALVKLCETAGIEVPKEKEKKKVPAVQPQWAFFDSDFIQVKFLAAENTSTIFLQLKKFEKLLKTLEDDCQKEASGTIAQQTKKSKSVIRTVTAGMFCLALFEDGKWNRGRVESENETQFYVFFIDHGDFVFVSKQDVIPISKTLLLRLPCQAIECTLVGIQTQPECPLEVLKEIYDFSEDGKQYLYASVVDKNLKPSITGGRKYKVNLLSKKGVSLNKMLVDSGMVTAEESERKYLEDIEVQASDDEESHDEEEEEIPEVKISSEEYWEGQLKDDAFEDESALEFLKEFASKVFPGSSHLKLTPSVSKEVPKEKERSPPGKDVEAAKPAEEPTAQSVQDPSEQSRKKLERKLVLRSREKVMTPQVLWCQNQLQVEIKIVLGNVKDYSLECTINNISFRCFLEEVFYAVDFKLFGSINPQMTKITLKAFHVLVVLTKLASPLWPRLNADKGKHRWISLDVESLVDKEDIFSEKIESAKMDIEAGRIKKGIRTDTIEAYSESYDSGDENKFNIDSDGSEGFA